MRIFLVSQPPISPKPWWLVKITMLYYIQKMKPDRGFGLEYMSKHAGLSLFAC